MIPHPNCAPFRRPRSQRGFTLLESLIAAGILLGVVIAVTTAVTAGQQHAYEAHQTITGTLAAEDLMTRLANVPYESLSTQWNGHDEEPGTMTDANGSAMPGSFAGVGRRVQVMTSLQVMPSIGVQVLGRTVSVRAYDADDRTLVILRCFVPQPAAASLPPDEDDLLGDLLGGVNDLLGGVLGGLGGLGGSK